MSIKNKPGPRPGQPRPKDAAKPGPKVGSTHNIPRCDKGDTVQATLKISHECLALFKSKAKDFCVTQRAVFETMTPLVMMNHVKTPPTTTGFLVKCPIKVSRQSWEQFRAKADLFGVSYRVLFEVGLYLI